MFNEKIFKTAGLFRAFNMFSSSPLYVSKKQMYSFWDLLNCWTMKSPIPFYFGTPNGISIL